MNRIGASKKGTITLRVFDDDRRQVVNILRWAKERLGEATPRDLKIAARDNPLLRAFALVALSPW